MQALHPWRIKLPIDTIRTIEDSPFVDLTKGLMHIAVQWSPYGDLKAYKLNYPKP